MLTESLFYFSITTVPNQAGILTLMQNTPTEDFVDKPAALNAIWKITGCAMQAHAPPQKVHTGVGTTT